MRPGPLSNRPVSPPKVSLRGRTPRLAALGAVALAVMTALAMAGASPAGAFHPEPFLSDFNTVSTVASTVPVTGR